MATPYADLHVHTTRSDGQLELDDVPEAAARAGVSVVGLTDHDRVQPFQGPAVVRDGVTLVHGIELRVEHEALRLDLLGYGVRPTPELESIIEDIQENRRERGRAIVECVESQLGIDLDVPIEDGLGRPHIATAIGDHPGTRLGYQDAFDELIGADGPCYVARDIPSFDEGRSVLADACAVVSLAHPLRYGEPSTALSLVDSLDAVELHYPYGRSVDLELVRDTAGATGALVTGGSDAHDRELGVSGITQTEFEALDLPTP